MQDKFQVGLGKKTKKLSMVDHFRAATWTWLRQARGWIGHVSTRQTGSGSHGLEFFFRITYLWCAKENIKEYNHWSRVSFLQLWLFKSAHFSPNTAEPSHKVVKALFNCWMKKVDAPHCCSLWQTCRWCRYVSTFSRSARMPCSST